MKNYFNDSIETASNQDDLYIEIIQDNLNRTNHLSLSCKLLINVFNAGKTDYYKKLNIPFSEEQIFKLCIYTLDFIWKFNLQNVDKICTNEDIEKFYTFFFDTYLNSTCDVIDVELKEEDICKLTKYIMNQILCESINKVIEWHNDYSERHPKIINFVQRIQGSGDSQSGYTIKNDGIRLLVNSLDVFNYLTNDIEDIMMKQSIEHSNLSNFKVVMEQQIARLVQKENEIFTDYDMSENDMYILRFDNHRQKVENFKNELSEMEMKHETLLEAIKQKIPNSVNDYGIMKQIDMSVSSMKEIENYQNLNGILNRLKWMIQLIKRIDFKMAAHWNEYERLKKNIKIPKVAKQNHIFKNYLDEMILNRQEIDEIFYYIGSALPYRKNKKVFQYDKDNKIVGTKKRKRTLPLNYFEKTILEVHEEDEVAINVNPELLLKEQERKKEQIKVINNEKKLYVQCLIDCLATSDTHSVRLEEVIKTIKKQKNENPIIYSGVFRTFFNTLVKNEKEYLFTKKYSSKSLEHQTLSQMLYEANKACHSPFKKIEWSWDMSYITISIDENLGILERIPNITIKGITE